jgi:stearoyl-CoA desaturase (delta-9 desaturase)
MQIVWGYIGFGAVNAVCHWKGKPRNNYIVALLTGGEGWHKNHHDKPQAWNLGWKWYEWDPGAWFIRLIRK